MTDSGPILPLIEAPDGGGSRGGARRPLVDGLSPRVPWVTYTRGALHDLESVHDRERAALDETSDAAAAAALTNLRARGLEWSGHTDPGPDGEPLRMLICDDLLAAEGVLDPELLRAAQRALGTTIVAIGVPRRGLLLAADGLQDRDGLARFVATVARQHQHAQTSPLTPIVFAAHDGELIGMLGGDDEPEEAPAPRAEERAAPVVNGSAPSDAPEFDFADLPPIPEGSSYGAEWWIALSHLRSKKREAFVSLVTVLSIIGVVAGVAVLNWVISVMYGFEIDLRDKILGANAHVVVLRYGGNIVDVDTQLEKVNAVRGVDAAAPFVYTELMIRSSWASSGIVLKGLDPELTADVTHLRDDLLYGYQGELTTADERASLFSQLGDLFPPRDGASAGADGGDDKPLPGLVIGRELMKQLQVSPGDKVQIINPLGDGAGLMGMPVPTVRVFRVAGVFYSGMYEYDTKWTYVDNEAAQGLLKMGDAYTGIEVKVRDIDDVERISAEIDASLGYPHYSRTWKTLNSKLFDALRLEKWVMGLILSMIVVVAALLIVTTLIMLVITKGREIAILKAMGASRRGIMRIFIIEGSLIGAVGSVVGTVLGLIGCAILQEYGYPLDTDVYYLSELPVVVEASNVAVIALAAFVICFLATLYPAWKAASLDPVEGLRYE